MSAVLSISVPADLARFVEQSLASGRYGSTTDVVIDGLTLLKERERCRDELRSEIMPSLERLDRGEGIDLASDDDLDRFFDEINSRGR